MKRGCFLSLLILGACIGTYWYLLHGHIEPPVFYWAVGIASFFMWISAGALQTAGMAARDASRVSGQSEFAGYSGEQYADGETITVVGRTRAVSQPLRAPFSGLPAVLYSYEIEHYSARGNDSSTMKDYSGFALAPTSIDTTRGSVLLLGFPLLQGFPKNWPDTDEARKNAAAYIATTQFSDMKGFHPGAIYHEIRDLLTDDDGQLRKDWRMTDDTDLSGKTLKEEIVAPGEQVCAIGKWSASKRGIVPGGTNGVIQLMRGEPQKVVSGLWGKFGRNLVGGLIVGALVNGAVYVMLQVAAGKTTVFRGTPIAEHSIHSNEMHGAVTSGDVPAAEKLFKNGTGIDVKDSDGRTPLAVAQDATIARWLIEHGADVNAANGDGQTVLMQQASAGRADIVALLIKSGAKLDTVSTRWHSTALKQALDAEKIDVVRLLRDAGAKDETVTEMRGQPLNESDPPVRAVFAYVDAIQREDKDALVNLSTFKSFDDVDFKIWKESRPVHPKMISGHATEDAATIALRGAIPSGRIETWTYQVVHRGTDWRVSDERWETRLSGKED